MTTTTITWHDVRTEARAIAGRADVRARLRSEEDRTRATLPDVYGVPRGGCTVAALVATYLDTRALDEPVPGCLIVDDLIDSGNTARRFTHAGYDFDALYRKPGSPSGIAPEATRRDGWLVFPWEQADEAGGPEDAVVRLLEHVGEDPNREGLLNTPGRVLRAYTEMTEGYGQDPADILSTVFDEQHESMVVLDGIDFTSLCEHHLLPFVGTATVGYIPAGNVVGLSKLARLVECYARRLQVQERMTDQIADALVDHLHPLGAGVVVTAHHACMGCRGVRKPGARMTTSALRGVMLHGDAARSEFMGLARLR